MSKRHQVHAVIKHPGNVVEIKVELSEPFAGKIAWICCPSVSVFEWHPFTFTAYDPSRGTCSFHVKTRGDWTASFTKRLGVDTHKDIVYPTDFPRLLIDGPYHDLPSAFANLISRKPCLLISSGVGLTKFMYALSQMQNMLSNGGIAAPPTHLVIIVKKPQDIMWAIPFMQTLKDVTVHMFFTDPTVRSIENFPFVYTLGRPDFNHIFHNAYMYTVLGKNDKIKVYFSGKTRVAREIRKQCSEERLDTYFDFVFLS
jgi:predicted ferric reductase